MEKKGTRVLFVCLFYEDTVLKEVEMEDAFAAVLEFKTILATSDSLENS
jgi:hypothetical protein